MLGEKGLVVLLVLLSMSVAVLLLMMVMVMLLLLLRGFHFDFTDRRVNLTPLALVMTRFFREDGAFRFGEEEEEKEEAISVGDVKCKLCGTDQKSSSELTPKERQRRRSTKRIAKFTSVDVFPFHQFE